MPIHLRLKIAESVPVLRGHDHYWRTILQLTADGEGFTAYAVAQQSSPRMGPDIRDFVRRLVLAGIARRGDDGLVVLERRPRETPRLNRDGTEAPQWRGRQQMWNVMRRATGGFTLQELAIDATTDTIPVNEAAANAYCQPLVAAGVLLVTNPQRKRGTPAIFRLTGSGNTGPRPPKIIRARAVFDQNLERIVGEAIAEEVDE